MVRVILGRVLNTNVLRIEKLVTAIAGRRP
jgi:hypothetical protein